MHQEEFAHGMGAQTSSVIREPPQRRSAVVLELRLRRVYLQLGGLWAGTTKLDQPYTLVRDGELFRDRIQWGDTFGAKAKLTVELGRVRWYVQAQYRGLVADGGPDSVITLTDWSMKQSSRGNQIGGESGLTIDAGPFQIGPKILYQRPLVGPNPKIDDMYDPATGIYTPGVRPRNVLMDPFAVRDNREILGGELMLEYDPTPATWFFNWDRAEREDARFAFAIDAVYRHQPTSLDSGIAILADGTLVPFGAAPPAHDTWDVNFHFVANPAHRLRLVGRLYAGQVQSTGMDPRLVTRGGGEIKLIWRTWLLSTILRFHDWGPYDYQRDFNLTFPVQYYGDLSYALSSVMPRWLGTRIGIRAQVRTLDGYSEGYLYNPSNPGADGLEYEVGTYVNLSL
jgi:hypothetical protein